MVWAGPLCSIPGISPRSADLGVGGKSHVPGFPREMQSERYSCATWRSPRGPQSCGDPVWPPTQSTRTSFPAVDMAVAAENPASAASGSEASAGHDVIFPFRSWPSVGLVGVQEHTLSGSATARKGGGEQKEKTSHRPACPGPQDAGP